MEKLGAKILAPGKQNSPLITGLSRYPVFFAMPRAVSVCVTLMGDE